MHIVETITDLQAQVASWRLEGKRIAFVPTMGNLHQGHLALVREAHRHAEVVIVSIFVNPMQFGENEDFNTYPRTAEADQQALEAEHVALLFMPSLAVIYPRGLQAQTFVEVPGLSDILCGASRPGHFRGVATVVNRLFNLVRPDVAIFGKKDYQQLLVIQLMVGDLGMPVEIVGLDTVREPDGLAMSSRNHYLSVDERKIAPRLYAALIALRDKIIRAGEIASDIEDVSSNTLTHAGFTPDYISIRRRQDLASPDKGDTQLIILVAAWLGATRLIDNLEFDLM